MWSFHSIVYFSLLYTLSFSSFLKGDIFIVHNELDDGWMWVTNVRTEEQGLIVDDLVEEVVSVFELVSFESTLQNISVNFLWICTLIKILI